MTLSTEYRPSERLRTAGLSCYHYVAQGLYLVQGGFITAGGSLAWLVKLLSGLTGNNQRAEATANAVPSNVYPSDPTDAQQYATLYHDLYLPLYPLLKETSHKLVTMPQIL